MPDNVILALLVGWDDAGFRQGFGGGCFDRKLRPRDPSLLTIGI